MDPAKVPDFLKKLTGSKRDETVGQKPSAEVKNIGAQELRDSEEVGDDTVEVTEIARTVAPFLGNNPRRIKQFLNVFRLRRFIAFHTRESGSGPAGTKSSNGLTLQQLGKCITIMLRWPSLLEDLFADEELLADLQREAWRVEARRNEGPDDAGQRRKDLDLERFDYWRGREQLLRFFSANCKPDEADSNWTMLTVNLPVLFQIAPFTISISPNAARGERLKDYLENTRQEMEIARKVGPLIDRSVEGVTKR
jgi:hypothetical protein